MISYVMEPMTQITMCLFPYIIICIDGDFYLCLWTEIESMILGFCLILPLEVKSKAMISFCEI